MTLDRHNTEVLLVNLGTPAAPTALEVRRFLEEFLSDPLVVDWPRSLWLPILRGIVLRRRPERVAEMYRTIWTESGSPLRVQSNAIARGLEAALAPDVSVRAVYRYGEPGLEQEVLAAAERARRIVVVPLFPQRTASSSGSVEDEVARITRTHDLAERVECVALAPDDADYIAALADRARTSFDAHDSPPEHLLLSFHGIPARVDRAEQRRYSRDCARTASALLDALDWEPDRATLCYQSRFGPERWLRPSTAGLLMDLPVRGVRRLGVIAPGFLTDGLETLEELGVRGRKDFLTFGGQKLTLVPALADSPALIAALARLVRLRPKKLAP